jgi:polysaccharide pyruvyl transferase WcaK-like protein
LFLQIIQKQYDTKADDLFKVLGLKERSRWSNMTTQSIEEPTWADAFARIGVLQERSNRLIELKSNQRIIQENEELREKLNIINP